MWTEIVAGSSLWFWPHHQHTWVQTQVALLVFSSRQLGAFCSRGILLCYYAGPIQEVIHVGRHQFQHSYAV